MLTPYEIPASSELTRAMWPPVGWASNAQPTTSAAHWIYLGLTPQFQTWNWLNLRVFTAGAGAQTAELALAMSNGPPRAATQPLTILWTATLTDALTSTGRKRNSAAMNLTLRGGLHLWGAVRVVMATTLPSLYQTQPDLGLGYAMVQTSSPALTTLAVGSIVTPAAINGSGANTSGPLLALSVD